MTEQIKERRRNVDHRQEVHSEPFTTCNMINNKTSQPFYDFIALLWNPADSLMKQSEVVLSFIHRQNIGTHEEEQQTLRSLSLYCFIGRDAEL